MYVWGYFWAFYSVPLIYVSVFMSVPNCCVYCGFVIKFEIRKCEVSSLVLLPQDCFGYLGSNIVFLKMQNTELRWKARKGTIQMPGRQGGLMQQWVGAHVSNQSASMPKGLQHQRLPENSQPQWKQCLHQGSQQMASFVKGPCKKQPWNQPWGHLHNLLCAWEGLPCGRLFQWRGLIGQEYHVQEEIQRS